MGNNRTKQKNNNQSIVAGAETGDNISDNTHPQFTQGKWSFDESTGMILADGKPIAHVYYSFNNKQGTVTGQANAQLIVATPEMCSLLHSLVGGDKDTATLSKTIERAKELLKRLENSADSSHADSPDMTDTHKIGQNLALLQYASDMYKLLFRIRDARIQGAALRGRQAVNDPVVKEITQLFKLISGDDEDNISSID